VCVYQTAVDLIRQGFEVQIISDAVSSRVESNKTIGLEKMKAAGAILSSTEMALFEILKAAEGEYFKKIINLLK
jgi:nicotinamidase-related amidase